MPFRIVRTSAKSRLMMPGMVMMSLMPWTAWRSTSSAMRNASKKLVPFSMVLIRRSLGMTMTVSTQATSSASACSACTIRRLPSKENGLVTTATAREPSSLASEATTGAAPEPVPPPRPAVMNTMSAPSSASMIFSVSSSAALRPMSGLAPAPRPLVSFAPICSFTCAAESWSACWSVFAAINSTPSTFARIMRLTALDPPPPTPITLILAASAWSSLNEYFTPASFCAMLPPSLSCFPFPANASPLPNFLPLLPPSRRAGLLPRPARLRAVPVERQPRGHRELGMGKLLGHPGDAARAAQPHGHAEQPLHQVRQPAQSRPAAGQHDSRGDARIQASVLQLGVHQLEQFGGARLGNIREHAGKNRARRPPAHARNFNGRIAAQQLAEHTGVLALQCFCLRHRSAQAHGQIVGKVVAAHRDRRGVPHHAVGDDDHFRGSRAEIEQAAALLALFGGERGLGGGEGFQHGGGYLDPREVQRAHQVLLRGGGRRHDVDVGLELLPQQAHGLANVVLPIEEKFLREDVQDH